MRPGHLGLRVVDSSRRSEETVKKISIAPSNAIIIIRRSAPRISLKLCNVFETIPSPPPKKKTPKKPPKNKKQNTHTHTHTHTQKKTNTKQKQTPPQKKPNKTNKQKTKTNPTTKSANLRTIKTIAQVLPVSRKPRKSKQSFIRREPLRLIAGKKI